MYGVELYLGSAFTGDTTYFPLFENIETAISAVCEKIGHGAVVDRMNAEYAIVYEDERTEWHISKLRQLMY